MIYKHLFLIVREVVIDSEQNIPYDVFMTKVDLNCGINGCYSFFKMQVINIS